MYSACYMNLECLQTCMERITPEGCPCLHVCAMACVSMHNNDEKIKTIIENADKDDTKW